MFRARLVTVLISAAVSAWSPAQADDVFARVIPLPKEAVCGPAHTLSADDVALVLPQGNAPVYGTIARLMTPFAKATSADVALRFVLFDEEEALPDAVARLDGVANYEESYAIVPRTGSDGAFAGLDVLAPKPLGLLYGARTLAQLLGPDAKDDGTVVIPEVRILDWPDIAERGTWGDVEIEDLEWMSARKLNHVDRAVRIPYDASTGAVTAEWDDAMQAEADRTGVTLVPYIPHLERQYTRSGLAKVRPELAAAPDPSEPPARSHSPAFCFSKPGTVAVLRDWLTAVLDATGSPVVLVWLSEERTPCYCSECAGKDPYVIEVGALRKAFAAVKTNHPDARLRLLLTQGSYPSNDTILDANPSDIGIVYYHGGLTYDSSHHPMIYPRLETFVEDGGWLGVYPQVTNSWLLTTPMTSPQFIRIRMREFADKGLANVVMFAVPGMHYHPFNVTAAAEWMWNAHGRTDEEYGRAYALAAGSADPALYAKWAALVGPIGWDCAGSRFVYEYMWNDMIDLDPLEFGDWSLLEIYSEGELDALIANAEKAVAMASGLDDEAAVSESRILLAKLQLAKGLYVLTHAPASAEGLDAAALEPYRAARDLIDAAARVYETEHYRWVDTVAPGVRTGPRARSLNPFRNTAAFGGRCVLYATRVAQRLGLDDPSPTRHPVRLGGWDSADSDESADFGDSDDAALSLDFDAAWQGPGMYVLSFVFDWEDGYYGTRIGRVTLSSVDESGVAHPVTALALNESITKGWPWRDLRFAFPEIPRGHRPRITIDLSVGSDAPEGVRNVRGEVFARRGYE